MPLYLLFVGRFVITQPKNIVHTSFIILRKLYKYLSWNVIFACFIF